MGAITGTLGCMASWVDLLGRQSLCAAIVFGAVVTAASLTRGRGPGLRVALWSLVFVRLVLPPGLTHPMSVGALLNRLTEAPLPFAGTDRDAGEVSAALVGPRVKTSGTPGTTTPVPLTSWLAVAWLIGAVATYGIYRRRRREFIRVARAAKPLKHGDALAIAKTWSSRLRLRRAVLLVSSAESVVPFTFGVIRPVVFVPKAVADDPQSLEPVLAHEMAHVASFDALWLAVQHILQSAFFFHPLVWISSAKLNDEREKLCDATVVSAGRLAARDYVGGLLNVLRLDLQEVGAPTMTAQKRRIGVRIKNIIDCDGGSRPRLGFAFAGAAAVGVFLLPLAGGVDATPASDVHPQTGASTARSVETDLHIVNPLPGGRVTRSWGPGYIDPFTKKKVFHRGIDVAAPAGTRVLAAAGGVVRVATERYEEVPGAGTVIVIDHGNGYSTYYGHLDSFRVSPGQKVESGETIGSVGSTGKSTGSHLHFEVQNDGTTEDPAIFVAEWR